MLRKIIFLVIVSYILVLLQSSFLIHFNILGAIPNFILILVFLLNFFEEPNEHWGIFGAVIGGFFLDIFSTSFLGSSIICLIIMSFFIKKFLHILKETPNRYPIIYFLPLFIFSVILYDFLLGLTFYFFTSSSFQFSLGLVTLIKIVYNLVFALFGFCLFKGCKLYEIFKKI